jgi:Raf kinase inhibitor-like YbhB/YbcL family protein
MRRRRSALLALAAVALAACDTDDGRQMQTPDSYAVFQLQSTTPSTTSTVPPTPTEIALVPPTTFSSTSPASSTTSASAPSSTSNASTTTAAGAAINPAADSSGQLMQFSGPWVDGAAIPASFTCDGADDAPLITWTAPPDGTVELAMSVTDPDAGGFVHWLAYDIPAAADGSLPTGVSGGSSAPAEGRNGFGRVGWGGPCPPSGTHRYEFTLYALDRELSLPGASGLSTLQAAMRDHVIAQATLTGRYKRG